ncbi:hypothetical protein ACP275_04G115300 [Erythranthe tilingii]
MPLDNVITSPHRRSQTQTAFSQGTPKKRDPRGGEELGSFMTLIQRHRFLLVALVLLTFLCTVYLYFAVTLGTSDECSGLIGARRATCNLKLVKDSVAGKGKLKFF